MRYMLDTNTCIHIIKYRPDTLCDRLSSLSIDDVGVSSVVAAELWYGVALSQKKKQNEAALRDFFDYVEVLDWPSVAGPIYGQIRAHLKKTGMPIGASSKKPIGFMPAWIIMPATVRLVLVPMIVVTPPRIVA